MLRTARQRRVRERDITWAVVANGTYARLFREEGGRFEEFECLVHPDSRAHNQALLTDRGGRVFDSAGSGRHTMVARSQPKRVEIASFAREVAVRLERGRRAGEFNALVLVAAPAILGQLRRCFGVPLRRTLRHSLPKDLVHENSESLDQALTETLRPS